MAELKGSKTEENLLKAFAGESQARNRYTFYAKEAQKEGYQQIGGIFLETADHERQHAKRFYKHLEGGTVEITATYPAGPWRAPRPSTWPAPPPASTRSGCDLYPAFADVAEAEGFQDVATTFRMVAKAEAMHEERYRKLLANVETGEVFEKPEKVTLDVPQVRLHPRGPEGAQDVPDLPHPQPYFQVFAENY